jgi:DNA-binding Lrp family transcriptional regulator
MNPYRDLKEFASLDKAKDYVGLKLVKKSQDKKKKIDKLPKSLYLVLIKEESTGKTFVKVGITSKRFIMRRFSKAYGYEGYIVETILRRIDTPNAEKLENDIKEKLNKKRSVKKYRPVLESFSGYSECFDYLCLDEILNIFDEMTKKC